MPKVDLIECITNLYLRKVLKVDFDLINESVYRRYEKFNINNIPVNWNQKGLEKLTHEESMVLIQLSLLFSDLETHDLVEIIQNEKPYQETKFDEEVSNPKNKEFFKTQFHDFNCLT